MKVVPYFLGNPESAYNLAGCDEHEVTLAVAHNLGLLVLELRAAADLKRDHFAQVLAGVHQLAARMPS